MNKLQTKFNRVLIKHQPTYKSLLRSTCLFIFNLIIFIKKFIIPIKVFFIKIILKRGEIAYIIPIGFFLGLNLKSDFCFSDFNRYFEIASVTMPLCS